MGLRKIAGLDSECWIKTACRNRGLQKNTLFAFKTKTSYKSHQK